MATIPCASEPLGVSRSPAGKPPYGPPHFGLNQGLYERFQRLIYSETGIWLSDAKKALLCGRLSKRLRALDLNKLADYYKLVSHPDQQPERTLMIDAITTNETHFFREPKHFEFLAQQVIPGWQREAEHRLRSKKVRVWSAGCSSGEEAYSVAMLLARDLPEAEGWDVQVLATDISTRVLEKARHGIYSLERAQEIPTPLLRQFVLKGIDTQTGYMKIMPEIRQMTRFMRVNLSNGPFSFESAFDLILCRNVLIYFDRNSKHKAVENIVRCLAPGGLLLLGHAEHLNPVTFGIRSLAATIYCRAENHKRLTRNFRSA